MKNSIIIFLLLIISFVTSAYKRPEFYTIDAVKNAYIHNNKGLYYIREGLFYPAIQEFKIAISLNPDTQATSVYYNNLGEVYMKIGMAEEALDCFERAITQYSLNFKYYQNLADCYAILNISDKKMSETADRSNSLNLIMRGLIYEKQGNIRQAITTLDEFSYLEPDLIITPAVRNHVQKLIKENL